VEDSRDESEQLEEIREHGWVDDSWEGNICRENSCSYNILAQSEESKRDEVFE
jgi:hypothetical protein